MRFNNLHLDFNSESRERAYVYAISSAGAAYAVTRACSRGEIISCGCDGKASQRTKKVRSLD